MSWQCKHCNQKFNFSSTSEKANHSRWCNPLSRIKHKKKCDTRRIEKFNSLDLKCKICKKLLTFEMYESGKRDFCGSKKCRSIINRNNSLKQDKSQISEQVRNSPKWKVAQRDNLLKKISRIENSYKIILKEFFDNVESQKLIIYNGKNKFVDFCVDGVLVEIDGPYHNECKDQEFNDYCKLNKIPLIRVDVNKHWTLIMQEIPKIIKGIGSARGGHLPCKQDIRWVRIP